MSGSRSRVRLLWLWLREGGDSPGVCGFFQAALSEIRERAGGVDTALPVREKRGDARGYYLLRKEGLLEGFEVGILRWLCEFL
jgi:hypothetical protein